MSEELDPVCWHADEDERHAYLMFVHAREDGLLGLKIMGDALSTTPAYAREFARRLVAAADRVDANQQYDIMFRAWKRTCR